ncbi:hypothetical protein BLA29_006510 [Euroglyphus maynei]|uniref:Uncharacterized protein n=1 Tax=Euroglyphus maynei TaxID=6958 RepID=A0A1Y3AUD5_EURMA|nr:hypothetical protein BLA29_006510 [Euroglyphus maynei]
MTIDGDDSVRKPELSNQPNIQRSNQGDNHSILTSSFKVNPLGFRSLSAKLDNIEKRSLKYPCISNSENDQRMNIWLVNLSHSNIPRQELFLLIGTAWFITRISAIQGKHMSVTAASIWPTIYLSVTGLARLIQYGNPLDYCRRAPSLCLPIN